MPGIPWWALLQPTPEQRSTGLGALSLGQLRDISAPSNVAQGLYQHFVKGPLDLAAGIGKSAMTTPNWGYTDTGETDPNAIGQSLAGAQLAMTGGAAESPTTYGMTLGSGPRLPRLVAALHGTTSDIPFETLGAGFAGSKVGGGDFGAWVSRDPRVSVQYAMHPNDYGGVKLGRTYPVLADMRKTFSGFGPHERINDAIFTNPEDAQYSIGFAPNMDKIIRRLGSSRGEPRYTPEQAALGGALAEAAQGNTWTQDFLRIMKQHGYDSMKTVHGTVGGGPESRAYMLFDPEQAIPTYSPQGQKLAKERGVFPMIKQPALHQMDVDWINKMFPGRRG